MITKATGQNSHSPCLLVQSMQFVDNANTCLNIHIRITASLQIHFAAQQSKGRFYHDLAAYIMKSVILSHLICNKEYIFSIDWFSVLVRD